MIWVQTITASLNGQPAFYWLKLRLGAQLSYERETSTDISYLSCMIGLCLVMVDMFSNEVSLCFLFRF